MKLAEASSIFLSNINDDPDNLMSASSKIVAFFRNSQQGLYFQYKQYDMMERHRIFRRM